MGIREICSRTWIHAAAAVRENAAVRGCKYTWNGQRNTQNMCLLYGNNGRDT